MGTIHFSVLLVSLSIKLKEQTMELQIIQSKIYDIRGFKVMLDFDLATLYEVETRVLNQAVKRNSKRFPSDFMFQLTKYEWEILMSQFVISKTEKRGGTQKLPYAFTEQGLAMLSGILNSDKAIDVNISIMRAFVVLRQYALGYAELNHKFETFMIETNMQFNDIYMALTELAEKNITEKDQRKQIGYRIGNREQKD
jgi:hypothetical protein